jgi:hypothetical protein
MATMHESDQMGNLRFYLPGVTSSNACTVHRLKTFSITMIALESKKKLSNITDLLQYHIMSNLTVFTSFTTKKMSDIRIQIPYLLLQVMPLGTTLTFWHRSFIFKF